MGQARQICPHCGRKPGTPHGGSCPRSTDSLKKLEGFLMSLEATPLGRWVSDRRMGFIMRKAERVRRGVQLVRLRKILKAKEKS